MIETSRDKLVAGRVTPGLFDEQLESVHAGLARRVNADREELEKGLAQLVMTVIELLRQLMERIRQDRYPSHQLMDRVEAAFWTQDQIAQYVDLLLEKADEDWYPSKQILDRIHRLLAYTASATR